MREWNDSMPFLELIQGNRRPMLSARDGHVFAVRSKGDKNARRSAKGGTELGRKEFRNIR